MSPAAIFAHDRDSLNYSIQFGLQDAPVGSGGETTIYKDASCMHVRTYKHHSFSCSLTRIRVKIALYQSAIIIAIIITIIIGLRTTKTSGQLYRKAYDARQVNKHTHAYKHTHAQIAHLFVHSIFPSGVRQHPGIYSKSREYEAE